MHVVRIVSDPRINDMKVSWLFCLLDEILCTEQQTIRTI